MKKYMRRNDETAVVAGVVSGLADYFEHDPAIFRLAAITMLIVTGVFPGLLLYMLAWIFIPKHSRQADYIVE